MRKDVVTHEVGVFPLVDPAHFPGMEEVMRVPVVVAVVDPVMEPQVSAVHADDVGREVKAVHQGGNGDVQMDVVGEEYV